jgi:hypothetical protein
LNFENGEWGQTPVQIGAFPLPMHAYQTFQKAREHFENKTHFEMIWFGGISFVLHQNVFHASLDLTYKEVEMLQDNKNDSEEDGGGIGGRSEGNNMEES